MSEVIRLCILHFCLEELEAYRYPACGKIGEPGRLSDFIKKNVVLHVHPPELGVF